MNSTSPPFLPNASLAILDSLETYGQYFMNLSLWEPYVRQVYTRHSGTPPRSIRPGKAGTFPTFIVDDRLVIKFFGRLFDGENAFKVEQAANILVRSAGDFPAPRLLLEGVLSEDPPWRYLVFEFLPGISFGEVFPQVSRPEKERVAREVAALARRLHTIPLPDGSILCPGWASFAAFLHQRIQTCEQDQRAWGVLPEHLLAQIEEYILPLDVLIDFSDSPHLIHADLTGDHLLGSLENGIWQTNGIIDFGDAMTGCLYYELPALHLDLFRCDVPLLQVFLQAYGAADSFLDRFQHKAMSYVLLHPFNILSGIENHLPPLSDIRTLAELADLIWGS